MRFIVVINLLLFHLVLCNLQEAISVFHFNKESPETRIVKEITDKRQTDHLHAAILGTSQKIRSFTNSEEISFIFIEDTV